MMINPYPKITAPTAADITSKFTPSPPAAKLAVPGQSPAEYLAALEKGGHSQDAVNTLAHGLPERDSVHWACQSSRQVAGKMAPADKDALQAAEAWVKTPTEATKSQAAAAALKTDYKGPGAWAAQGAAWSQSPGGAVATGGPTAQAVAGSVNISSKMASAPAVPEAPKMPAMPTAPAAPTLAMPTAPVPPAPTAPRIPVTAPPVVEVPDNVLKQQAKEQKPFIDLGKDVASGKNTWA